MTLEWPSVIGEYKGMASAEGYLLFAYGEVDNTRFPSFDALQDALAQHGIMIHAHEIEYRISKEKLNHINAQYDGVNLYEIIDGMGRLSLAALW